MTFQLARRTRSVMLMVQAWPESGFREGAARLRPLAKRHCAPGAWLGHPCSANRAAGVGLVLLPPLPGTPSGDRFSEQRIGLDHLAIGVSSLQELERLAEVLRRNDVAADLHHDPMGPAIVTFRDPDSIQWEFFEQT